MPRGSRRPWFTSSRAISSKTPSRNSRSTFLSQICHEWPSSALAYSKGKRTTVRNGHCPVNFLVLAKSTVISLLNLQVVLVFAKYQPEVGMGRDSVWKGFKLWVTDITWAMARPQHLPAAPALLGELVRFRLPVRPALARHPSHVEVFHGRGHANPRGSSIASQARHSQPRPQGRTRSGRQR